MDTLDHIEPLDIETAESLQRKLYFLLEQLQNMHGNLPAEYQMRIPYELLSGLANSLLNETIFQIVKGLMEIQHVTEKQLYQFRNLLIKRQENEIQELLQSGYIPGSSVSNEFIKDKAFTIFLLLLKHKNELKENDYKTVIELDQKTKDLQETLEKAGIPGFYYTTNKKEVKVQMHLLDFILRLSKMTMPDVI